MRSILLCAALLATPTLAQDASAPLTKPAVAVAAATPAKPKMICRTIEKTGSRLGGTRTCLTQHDWDERAKEDQDWLDHASRVHTIPQL